MSKCHGLLILCLFCTVGATSAQKHAIDAPLFPLDSLTWVDTPTPTASELSGKFTVFHFWASWCAPCLKHLRVVQQQATTYQANVNTILVAWAATSADSVRAMQDRYAMPARWCIDPTNSLLFKHYGAYGLPYAVVHDGTGVAIWEGNGTYLTDSLLSVITTGEQPLLDPSDEQRTIFSLSIRQALPSDKNLMGIDTANGRLSFTARGLPPDAIVREVARFLGHKYLQASVQGEWNGRMFNVELSISKAVSNDSIRDAILMQLNMAMGIRSSITYQERSIVTVGIGDSTRFQQLTCSEGSASTGQDSSGLSASNTRIGSALSAFSRMGRYTVEYILDEVLNDSRICVRVPAKDQESVHNWFRSHGLRLNNEQRLLPHLITRYPESH